MPRIGALNSGYSGGSEGASAPRIFVWRLRLSQSLRGWKGGLLPLPSLVRRSWLQSDFEINYYYNPRVSPTYVSTSVTSVTRQETRTETGCEKREKREKHRSQSDRLISRPRRNGIVLYPLFRPEEASFSSSSSSFLRRTRTVYYIDLTSIYIKIGGFDFSGKPITKLEAST